MRIAVTYKDGQIYEHFGHCECVAIYDYSMKTQECNKKLVDTSDRHGHAAMIELMKEEKIDVLVSGSIGAEARNQLLALDIIPVIGYKGDTDMAVEMLMTGRLPMTDEGATCSGSCSSCCGDENGCGGH